MKRHPIHIAVIIFMVTLCISTIIKLLKESIIFRYAMFVLIVIALLISWYEYSKGKLQ